MGGGGADERFGVCVGMWNLGSLSGKGGEVCEELRKRMTDVSCLQVNGEGIVLAMKGRRYKPWWSGKGGVCGVGFKVKEELCEKVIEVRTVSDRVMTVVVFEEDVLRLICGYSPQRGKTVFL